MAIEQGPKRRPIGVWVVSAFYLLSAGWTLLSLGLIYNGMISINPAQQAYFASLTSIDWVLTLTIGVAGFTAAVFLFLLRRVAVTLFSVALVLNLGLTAFQMIRTNFIEAIGGPGLVGAFLGWLILIAVIVYARGLGRRGVLS
jgi:hypothetical protein